MIRRVVNMTPLNDFSFSWNWYNDPKFRNQESADSHIHPYYEICIHVSGDVSFLVSDTLYSPQKGDVLLTAPNQWHHCVYHTDTVHEHFRITLNGNHGFLPDETGLIRLPPPARDSMLTMCREINGRILSGERFSFREYSAVFAVFSCIFQSANERPPSAFMSGQLRSILTHLRTHFNEPVSLAEVADRFQISLSTLERQFKKELNITPFRYLQELRMSAACSLLEQGISVLDASMNCGFNDCSFFISQFKKRFGVTPYHYTKAQNRFFGEARRG